MERAARTETTLGDLITALVEEATPLLRSEQETYRVVAAVLTKLLGKKKSRMSWAVPCDFGGSD